jgi:hypothetical protein
MFKVLNASTEEIITECSDYEEAVSYMTKLNYNHNKTRIARNWCQDQERELYRDTNGNVSYGTYIIISKY